MVSEAHRRSAENQWLRRRLLERQLHDGATLRISALTLRLGLLQHRAPTDTQTVQHCIGELQDELHAVLEELRDIAAKIYPPLLGEAGLAPALREAADHLATPVTVVTSGERFGLAAEGAAYYAVTQCLAASPAPASAMQVILRREDNELMMSLSGVAAGHAHLVADQAWPLGGTVEVLDADSPSGGTITARIPCE